MSSTLISRSLKHVFLVLISCYLASMVILYSFNLHQTSQSNKSNKSNKLNQTFRPLPDLNKDYSLTEKIINPYHFSVVLNSERCDSDTQLLIVVHSSTKVGKSYDLLGGATTNIWLHTCQIWQSVMLHSHSDSESNRKLVSFKWRRWFWINCR